MARSIDTIQQEIITYKNDQIELDAMNSTSKRSMWYLWSYIVATAISVFEQLIDVFISKNEVLVNQSYSGGSLWLQKKVLEFQYSLTVPQIIQLIDGVAKYPIEDTTLRIITACSIDTTISGFINIKIAKSNPFVPLTGTELLAAQDYITTIGIAGLNYILISTNPDLVTVEADVYYKGQYSAIITDSVIASINNLLQSLALNNINGNIKISDLESAIRTTEGVNDVVLKNVKFRDDATPWASGIFAVQNNQLILRQYNSVAGYVIQETETGHKFIDTLNFISQ